MTSATRVVSLALALLLLVSGIAPVGGSGLADTGTTERNVAGVSGLTQSNNSSGTASNNTTITPHDNPDIRREGRELDGMQRWLSNRMGEVLVDCTEGAVADQSGVCDLNTTYPSYLERYADLAGETNAESDDEATQRFEEADDHQRKFNDNARDFYETKAEFEEAQANDNRQRQRELARDLLQDARAVNRSGGLLIGDYEAIMRLSGADLENGTAMVNRTRAEALETIALLDELYFIQTSIRARGLSETASFTEPMPIRGRLTMANGTAIGNRTIGLMVGGRPVMVETNETGWFGTRYRPQFDSLETSAITVRYIPANESLFLRSSTEVPVSIEQVTPTVQLTVRPSTAGFGDTVLLEGFVAVNGTRIAGVPFNLTVGSLAPIELETSSSGTFSHQVEIPATLDDGQQPVGAAVTLENRAIGPANSTAGLNVTTTATNLSIDARTTGERDVVVSGRLTTVEAPAPANRSIDLLVGDEVVATTRTDANGRYRTSFVVPADVVTNESNASVRIGGRFDEESTNLEPSAAETVIVVSATATETPANATETPAIPEIFLQLPLLEDLLQFLEDFQVPILLVVLVELLILLLMLVAGVYLWRRHGADVSIESTLGSADGSEAIPIDVEEEDFESVEPPTLLELAREQIEAGVPARGIEAGYLAVRRDLESRLDGGAPQTHWEFFARCAESELDDEELSALQELTQAYERAIFSPGGISRSDADTALSKAGSLFESLRQPT